MKKMFLILGVFVAQGAFAMSGADQLCGLIKKGHTQGVEQFLEDHPDVLEARDFGGYTPLMEAAFHGKEAIVALLLDRGADVDAVGGEERYTPLMLASGAGYAEIVTMLLKKGADVKRKNKAGLTALDRVKDGPHKEVAAVFYAQSQYDRGKFIDE